MKNDENKISILLSNNKEICIPITELATRLLLEIKLHHITVDIIAKENYYIISGKREELFDVLYLFTVKTSICTLE